MSHDAIVITSIIVGALCYGILVLWLFGAFGKKELTAMSKHSSKKSFGGPSNPDGVPLMTPHGTEDEDLIGTTTPFDRVLASENRS